MNCKECKHLKMYNSRSAATRKLCFCEHPDQKYIYDYFKKNRISKQQGFLCFTKPYTSEPTIKTAPAWCPLKREEGGGNE